MTKILTTLMHKKNDPPERSALRDKNADYAIVPDIYRHFADSFEGPCNA